MAAPNSKAVDPLDIMEHMINEVIVQSGKVLRENNRNGKRSTAIASAQLIHQADAKFNSALSELEFDIIRAKSVLLRDLTQLRSKKLPAPGLQPVPQAPTAPMTIDLSSPKLQHASVASNTISRPPIKAEAKQAAPFPNMGAPIPNMGIEAPKGQSPKLAFKSKPSPSAQPMSRIGSQGSKGPVKAGSPAMKVASPAMAKSVSPAMTKAASPAVAKTASPSMAKATASPAMSGKTGSPALKGATPAVKAGSPAVKTASPNVATKPTPKVTPSTAIPKATPPSSVPMPAPIQAPVPAMNPNPAPTPAMTAPASTPAPAPAAIPQAQTTNAAGDSLSNFFDLTSPTGGTGQANANAGLNFTDMQFSLAPAAGDARQQVTSADDDFDIEAYVGEAAQNLLIDDAFGVGGDIGGASGQPETANLDVLMGGTALPAASGAPPKADDKPPEANLDDLFNLNGTSIDMDMDMSGAGAEGTTNFDELFFDTNETSMEEFDNAYFGLE